MRISDELSQLIHSMSRTEKGYFKKYASRHVIGGENKYIRLFDFLEKQKKYNEREVRAAFRTERFVRQLHSIKNYLYNLILESLRAYHGGKNADRRIRDLLYDVHFLFDKALFSQCRKLLRRTRKICERHEKFIALLEVIQWEDLVERTEMRHHDQEEAIQARYREQEEVLARLHNYISYRRLGNAVNNRLQQTGFQGRGTEIKALEDFTSNRLLRERELAVSFRSQLIFCNINYLRCSMSGQPRKGLEFLRQALALLEVDTERVKACIFDYITLLCNYGSASSVMMDDVEFNMARDKLNGIEKKYHITLSENSRLRIFIFLGIHELLLYARLGMIPEGLEVAQRIEEGMLFYGNKISKPSLLVLYDNLASLYFLCGEYSRALLWSNRIINEEAGFARTDVQSFARIMHLILHFEMGSDRYLGYAIKSAFRFLYRHEKFFRGEAILLDFIRKAARVPTGGDMTAHFVALRKNLLRLARDPHEKQFLIYFDFLAWLDSKIEKITFADAVRNRKEFNRKLAG